ncbi:hypothetical protein ACFSNO_27310 [Streptomyces cirratus]
MLLPGRGPGLDLLALAGDSPDIDEAVDALLRLRAPGYGGNWRRSPSTRPLLLGPVRSRGDAEARARLATALAACHRVTVGPYWAAAHARLDAVRAQYARTFLEHGVEGLLTSLCPPLVRWRPPVLEVRHPRPGRRPPGRTRLVLAPTVFSWRELSLLYDPFDDASVPR